MSVKKKRALETIKIGNILYVEASRYDELRERVRKMLATLDMVIVFDGCARKAVEELL